MANNTPHFVMVACEENFQPFWSDAKEKAHFQTCPALKYILSHPSNGDPRMSVRLTEALGQDSQCLFYPGNVRVVQFFDRGAKLGAKKDGEVSHALTSR